MNLLMVQSRLQTTGTDIQTARQTKAVPSELPQRKNLLKLVQAADQLSSPHLGADELLLGIGGLRLLLQGVLSVQGVDGAVSCLLA